MFELNSLWYYTIIILFDDIALGNFQPGTPTIQEEQRLLFNAPKCKRDKNEKSYRDH